VVVELVVGVDPERGAVVGVVSQVQVEGEESAAAA
jgi:hypothetical protein